jgi:protein-disulfide isomerase
MNNATNTILESTRLAVPVSERDHIQGRGNAPLTLVEYADYQCPYCGEAHPMVKAVQRKLGNQLRFVFRNFPLVEAHPYAEHAAEAAEAAGARNRFWEMHDLLLENQPDLKDPQLAEYATRLGLDARAIITEIRESRFSARIREDFKGGVRSQVNGTPAFFTNGVRFDGDPDVNSLIEALKKASLEYPQQV